jgi:hypothetical protein
MNVAKDYERMATAMGALAEAKAVLGDLRFQTETDLPAAQ